VIRAGHGLAAQHPFVGHERRLWTVDQRAQLVPTVVLGDHLGQRPEREPAGVLGEHAGRPRAGGQQGESVLGERRRRPQLAAGGDRQPAAVAQTAQPVPVAGVGAFVDQAHERVEVGPGDERVQDRVVGVAGAQMTGHG
jgi:hypothetical protein